MDLLDSDDRTLFAAAVRRLGEPDGAARPLLEALALALGRGLPRAGRTWLSVAGALSEASIGEDAIDRLLREAAPYVLLDAEHGQSVYRLAHHSFGAFLIGDGHADRHRRVTAALVRAAAADLPRPPHPYLVRYLAGHAARAQAWQELERHPDLLDHLEPAAVAAAVLPGAFGRADLPPQVAATLMTHHLLAAVPPGDRASVRAVAAARLRPDPSPVEPNRGLPPQEPRDAGLSRNTWSAGATRGQRWQVGERSVVVVQTPPTDARRAVPPADGPASAAGGAVRWARLTAAPPHIVLVGHRGAVAALAAVPLPGGRTLLASAGDDGTVRLWDPRTARPVGEPLTGPAGRVLALTPVALPDRRWPALASSHDDGMVRLWDPVGGLLIREPFAAGDGPAYAIAAVPMPAGAVLLAVGGPTGAVHLWDPLTGLLVRVLEPDRRAAPTGAPAVRSIAVLPRESGGPLLVTCGGPPAQIGPVENVHAWDLDTGRPSEPPFGSQFGWSSNAETVASVPRPDGSTVLAIVRRDAFEHTLSLYDTSLNLRRVLSAERVRAATLWAVAPVVGGRVMLAAAGATGTRAWVGDGTTAERRGRLEPAGEYLTAERGAVSAVVGVPLPDGRTLVATAAADGTIQLWGPGLPTAEPTEPAEAVAAALTVTAVAAGPGRAGRAWLATGGGDGLVRLWDPDRGTLAHAPIHPQDGATTWLAGTTALAPVPAPDGRAELAVGSGRTLRIVDPDTAVAGPARSTYRLPWRAGRGWMTWNALLLVLPPAARRTPITAICVLSPPGDRTVLAVASGRTVQLWDRTPGGRLRRRAGSMRQPYPVVALAHLGRGLLAAAGGEVVHLWDTDRRRRPARLTTGGDGPVRALAALPAADGTARLAAAQGDSVWLWDDPRRAPAAATRPIERGRAVHALAVLQPVPHTTLLAVGDDVSVALWDPRSGVLARDLPLGVPVRDLAVAGGALYVGSTVGIVAIDLATLLGPAATRPEGS